MRYIQLSDELRLRFPGRGKDFDEGVEIGIIAAQMEFGLREFRRTLPDTTVAQARGLARKLGYHLVEGPCVDGLRDVAFRMGAARPKLTLVAGGG